MTEASELFRKIIKNDYCIGCGVCVSLPGSPFKLQMNEYGNIVAYPFKNLEQNRTKVLSICPFSNNAKDEDEISEIFFPDVIEKDHEIGKYLECFAGYVNEGSFREKGSSGGLGKWIGYILLKNDLIDFFVQVVPNQTNDPGQPLFDYAIFSDKNDVLKGSRSSYYPVNLVNVIKTIKEKNGRYAITGVPCFIKALRLLSGTDEDVRSRIKYCIGIICGGMKSANHAKIIGWQLGIRPENLIGIDFRRKYKDKPASNKIYQVWSNNDKTERFKNSVEIFGTDWGSGFFKPNACDFCDDVVGETADVSIGDAWLPEFENDPKGTSILIVRNLRILGILKNNNEKEVLKLFSLSKEQVKNSQAGGFRHRREALSFRIFKKKINNIWCPKKRVKPNQFRITRKRKRIYSLREIIAKQSHISSFNALNKDNLNFFFREMQPLVKKYHRANYGNLATRALIKLGKIISRILNH